MRFPSRKTYTLVLIFATIMNIYVAVCVVFMKQSKESVEPHKQGSLLYQDDQERSNLRQKLKDDIAKTMGCFNNTGLAVSVVINGQKIFSEGFGVTSTNRGRNVTSRTLFSIASLTKAFTAALLLDVMAKNGSVTLSSTIREVIGDWFRLNDSQRTQYTTIEDVLAHRLRVPENSGFRFNPAIDRHELLKRVQFFESRQEFRVKGTYSSTNYVMAAAITELIANNSWEDLMIKTIFKPLNMKSSKFAADVDFDVENVAVPVTTFDGQVQLIDPTFTKQWNSRCGSGCIFSNADDMSHWMNFHLGKGKDISGHQLFPESAIADLHSPRTLLPSSDLSLLQIPQFPVTQTGDLYALGWRVGYYRGYLTLIHTGSTPGYGSLLTLIPSENIGVFIALNGDDDNVYYRLSLQNYITDVILGLEPWLNTSTICTFPRPWHPREFSQVPVYDIGLNPFRKWTDYTGVYKNDGYGDIHIRFNTTLNGLIVRFGFGIWQLHPQSTRDVFYGKGMGVTNFYDIDFITFQASSDRDLIDCLIVKEFNKSIPPVFYKDMTLDDDVSLIKDY